MICLAGLTILNMERCLGRLSGCGADPAVAHRLRNAAWGVDPVVALHLWNAAEYLLPTFGPHGFKLGHS